MQYATDILPLPAFYQCSQYANDVDWYSLNGSYMQANNTSIPCNFAKDATVPWNSLKASCMCNPEACWLIYYPSSKPKPSPWTCKLLTCDVTNWTGVEGIISGCNKSGTGGSGLIWLLCTETCGWCPTGEQWGWLR